MIMDTKTTYTVECDPECSFMVRSHDKDEVVRMSIDHVQNVHGKSLSHDEAVAMVKES
jgi:predicted small metal-binding protein